MAQEIVLSKGRQAPKDPPHGFDPLLWRQLSSVGQHSTVPARHLLAEEGEPLQGIWMIASGLFALQKGNCVLDIGAPGEAVGGALVSSGEASPQTPITIQTIERSEFLFIPLPAFRSLVSQSDRLLSYIQTNFQKRMLFMQAMRSISTLDVGARLARLLLLKRDLFESHHITRRLMAQMVSTSTESVIRLLSDWQKNGWIHETDKGLRLIETQKLEDRWHAPTE